MAGWTFRLTSRAARLLPQPVRQLFYRLGPITHLTRKWLNRAAPHGLTTTEIAAGPLAGMQMVLDLQREKDYWLGTYEPHLFHAMREFVGEGMTVYDVGANIGYTTLAFARAIGKNGFVHAFEPLPDNFTRLEQNLELNDLLERVQAHRAAVTDRSGEVTFFVHQSGGMGKVAGSAGRDAAYEREEVLPSIALDDFIFLRGGHPPDAIKMDIEGGEVLALKGMRRTLADLRPILFLELHGHESALFTWAQLSDAGYSFHLMKGGYPEIQDPDEVSWKTYLLALPRLNVP